MANPVASALEKRVDRGTLPFAVGDVLVISGLLTFGTINHSSVEFVADNPLYLLGVLAPFLIAWVLVAPLVGAYSAGAGESAKASVPLVVRSWIPADILGVGLRATPFFEGGAALTFVAVTLVTGVVGLAAWRYLIFLFR
ncbi:DUF3054 domain-containing protein [Halegenticoccus tardaugens]|uniref:DUF3054 domain-containing protein n=1 Tax=Halegenticoccus tardaugens TaxID=2071624 RepID=UPI00100A8169|nr:DUF3054 domain-containing protein [Halegenticoccus tardaugens]